MANVYAGYMGLATVDGTNVRCTAFNINPTQTPSFYDHVIGVNDTIPTDSSTKGEEVGVIQTQRTLWRPSPIIINGSMSFPATEETSSLLFDHAKYGTYITEINFVHYCEASKTYFNCRVNTYNFSVSSGDIVNITSELYARDIQDGTNLNQYTDAQKLITWDKVTVNISPSLGTGINLEGINFNVNNNLVPIYTSDPTLIDPSITNKLYPADLRLGMQHVSGNLLIYLRKGTTLLNISTAITTISISCPGFSTTINVILTPEQIEGIIGPVITTIPFVGVDKAFGE